MQNTPESVPLGFSDLPDINNEPRYTTQISEVIQADDDRLVLRLERPPEFKFTAGQYLWLVLPTRSTHKGWVDRRAYSITSAPNDSYLELFIRIHLSDYLASVQNLKPGDSVQVIGPMGSIFTARPEGAICIAGGSGIAPFLSLIRAKEFKEDILISYGTGQQTQYFQKEISDIANSQGYQVIFKQSAPVAADFQDVVTQAKDKPISISGPQGFVDAVTSILKGIGVDTGRMQYEALYPTAEHDKQLEQIFGPVISSSMISNITGADKDEIPNLQDFMFLIIKQASNHIIVTDRNGCILFANPAAQELTGYSFTEMYGQTPRLWGGLMPSREYEGLWGRKDGGQFVTHQLINRRKDGRIYVALGRITPISVDGRVIAYVATEEDITALHQIDRAKTEFVSLASHQLRTPLSAINWYAEMLLAGDAGQISETQKSYLEEVYGANQRMVELINALLNVSRVELGTFKIEPELLNPITEAELVTKEIKPITQERQQQFTININPNTPKIYFDKKYLEMIYQNLLSNASKYTPVKGSISLSVDPVNAGDHVYDKTISADGIVITVSDNGYGIPVSAQGKIFSKMFRADNVREVDTDGTGLGLYIIKSIIDKCNGLLWFESVENKGTSFHAYLPLVTAEKIGEKKLS